MRSQVAVVLAVAGAALTGAVPLTGAGEASKIMRATLRAAPERIAALAGDCAHRDDVEVLGKDTAVTYVSLPELHALMEDGFEVLEAEAGRPFRELNPPDGYTPPEEMEAKFEALAAAHPAVAQWINLNEALDVPLNYDNDPIYVLKVSDNVAVDEDEENVFVMSQNHARELITPEIAYDTAERLLESPELRPLIDQYQIYIMPSMNPSGARRVWDADNMHRKNMRRNEDGSLGVDNNRNFDFGWDSSCGGSVIQSSQTYRGPSPGSEPEVQLIKALHADRQFAKVLDHHSSGREVRRGYGGCGERPVEMDAIWDFAADNMATLADYRVAPSCCLAGNIHYSFSEFGSLPILSETGRSFQPPADEMREEVARFWPATLWFLQQPTPVTGHITDAAGRPVSATIAFPDIDFSYDEAWPNNPRTGRFSLWLPSGTFNATVTTATTQVAVSITADQDNGAIQDIVV